VVASRVGPLEEQVGRFPDHRRDVEALDLRRPAPDGGHQVFEAHLEQLRVPEDRLDPLQVGVVGCKLEAHQLRAAADDRERAADLVDDPRSNRPICTRFSFKTATIVIWRYWTSRRTRASTISAGESLAT